MPSPLAASPAALLAALTVAVTAAGAADRAASKDPPTLSAIHANFDPEAKATFYTVTLTNPSTATNTSKPTFQWRLDPPKDDPACKKFQQSASNDAAAVWFHGESDGCTHKTPFHQGTVYVKVTVTLSNDSRPWVCDASYFGTLTGDGTAPGPCTIEASALVAVARPKTSTKEKWKIASEAFADSAEAEGIAAGAAGGLALIPPATAVATPIAGVLGAGAALNGGLKKLADWKAQDPPDPNFKTIAKAVVPPGVPHVVAGPGLPAAVADAFDALAANQGQTQAQTQAFVTSINRASGAHDAGNAAAQSAQEHAAAAFALAIAKLDLARPALRQRFADALAAAGIRFTLPPASFRIAQAAIVKHGFPAKVAAELARAGLTPAAIAQLRTLIAAAKPPAGAIAYPAALASPALVAADRADAQTMRDYAASVR